MSTDIYGDPGLPRRFWANAAQNESGCWLWTAALNGTGYGRIMIGGVRRGAHIVSWEYFRGPVPEGLELDHLCRVRHCVNPEHLEPVTHAENVRRGLAGAYMANRSHCANGHEFTPENTRVYRGARKCRRCQADTATKRRTDNPESVDEANARWRNGNRDRVNQWQRDYVDRNRDDVNARARAKRDAARERQS